MAEGGQLCACGCELPVQGEGRRYRQGHNSRRTVVSGNPNKERTKGATPLRALTSPFRPWSTPYTEPWAQAFRKRGGKLAFWKSGEVDAKFPDGRRQRFSTYEEAEEAVDETLKK